MTTLHSCLGIDDLLADADRLIPSWALSHPDLGPLWSRAEVLQATRTGTPEARNRVLLDLARLAHIDAGNSREAAALLCFMLIPGVLSKLRPLRGSAFRSDDVDQVAARHLWIESRTFRLGTCGRVAATICWRVRTATLADFGFPEIARFDRTWSKTYVLDQADLEQCLDATESPEATRQPSAELAELLETAESAGVISAEDVEFLRTVVAVGGRHPDRRVLTSGLMSAVVSREVGAVWGIGASTARRRLHRTINILSQAARSDLFNEVA